MEKRRGWKKLGLDQVESVADHSLALALLTLFEAERRGYDVGVAVRMALIHDLEEAIIGDLTPEDKKRMGDSKIRSAKQKAVQRILLALPPRSRTEYRHLWTDLRLLRSKEARLVHELDKLEMAFQAKAYGKRAGTSQVGDFYKSASKEIRDPALRKVLSGLTGNARLSGGRDASRT